MASAAIVIDNNADGSTVAASSQDLKMPVSNILTPHPSERWRSLSNSAWFVLDKGSLVPANTVMLCGLTCGENATVRLRLSTIDATGAAGDILDTGTLASGDLHFDVEYGSFVYQLPAPASWRYVRFDISDPDSTFVEAGCILDGLSDTFGINFSVGATFQHVDLSRVSNTSSGMTLTWDDSTFRRVDLSFDWVSETKRYGVLERLDRVKGRKRNVLLITNPDSENLPRDSIYGLVTDLTPITFGSGTIMDVFGKQLRIDERI
jgi:hypothetical protein